MQSGRQGLLTVCVYACVCLPDRRLALVQSGRQGSLCVCVHVCVPLTGDLPWCSLVGRDHSLILPVCVHVCDTYHLSLQGKRGHPSLLSKMERRNHKKKMPILGNEDELCFYALKSM